MSSPPLSGLVVELTPPPLATACPESTRDAYADGCFVLPVGPAAVDACLEDARAALAAERLRPAVRWWLRWVLLQGSAGVAADRRPFDALAAVAEAQGLGPEAGRLRAWAERAGGAIDTDLVESAGRLASAGDAGVATAVEVLCRHVLPDPATGQRPTALHRLDDHCVVCDAEVAAGAGLLLTTEELVSAPRYWRRLVEAYPKAFERLGTPTYDDLVRKYLFQGPMECGELVWSAAGRPGPALVCERCAGLFPSRRRARARARRWWATGGQEAGSGHGPVPIQQVRIYTGPRPDRINWPLAAILSLPLLIVCPVAIIMGLVIMAREASGKGQTPDNWTPGQPSQRTTGAACLLTVVWFMVLMMVAGLTGGFD